MMPVMVPQTESASRNRTAKLFERPFSARQAIYPYILRLANIGSAHYLNPWIGPSLPIGPNIPSALPCETDAVLGPHGE